MHDEQKSIATTYIHVGVRNACNGRDNHIAYIGYDVEKSPTGRIDFKALRGKSVPVIIIGKTRMNGFEASTFDKVYQQEIVQKPAQVLAPQAEK